MEMLPPSAHASQSSENAGLLGWIRQAFSGKTFDDRLKATVHLLRQASDHYDWVGIYLVTHETLVLAAFAGDAETEHTRIPIGQGICGLAAREGATIVVPDVNKDPRYLACFASTRSEIVVPIKGRKGVLGEIDIDSDQRSAFTDENQKSLETIASVLAEYLEG